MGKVNILHLSDLHLFNLNSVEYNSFKESMFERIKEFPLSPDLIMITGDIIDRGNCNLYQQVYDNFIVPLKDVTKCDVIFCTPGNHDVSRSEPVEQVLRDNKWIKIINKNGKTKSLSIEEDRQIRLEAENNKRKDIFEGRPETYMQSLFSRYENYIDFYKKLRPQITKSYSVEQIVIRPKTDAVNVRVISINSSILSNGVDDFQHLAISRQQLDDLCKSIKDKKLSKPDLTIAIMHHPVDWLTDYERDMLLRYFSNPNELQIDILLSGHTHEGKIRTCLHKLKTTQ